MRSNQSSIDRFVTTAATVPRRSRGFSLTEVLVVVAVIGVLTAISMPIMSNIMDGTRETKDLENAQRIETTSSALAALGVAHVIPQSLGGVEATVRLLRKGVVITDPTVPNRVFQISGLSDGDVSSSSSFLEIVYDSDELRLRFNSNNPT